MVPTPSFLSSHTHSLPLSLLVQFLWFLIPLCFFYLTGCFQPFRPSRSASLKSRHRPTNGTGSGFSLRRPGRSRGRNVGEASEYQASTKSQSVCGWYLAIGRPIN
ncbi:hypothetical protein BDQ94DRAFT_184945 [Aspergillus welwitschiae]|uniref:Uncharacterized protein n=1 Tax=Aspergillus welwitschiae TaxID=1341132 RepID=A0A3F3PK85_9EURO|nr:hypothetical protein BDQ94DRAFT_184945 [Aspergillus welwitschiae]RDH27364.1 hypothetical protein BDQ94DRAFT_184945 [Aspergillus welwitschiae]